MGGFPPRLEPLTFVKIAFATSELAPLITTGGLADVSGSLPAALRAQGLDLRVILPAYRSVLDFGLTLEPVGEIRCPGFAQPVRILRSQCPENGLPIYLVDSPLHFDRVGDPYRASDGSDWSDNGHRFTLFNHALAAIAQDRAGLDWRPDLLHCNDWQSGLAPALLSLERSRPGVIFTIHNLAYQGLFPRTLFKALELPEPLWSLDGVEFYEQLSFMKAGIRFADLVSTVSRTYAAEILTPELGFGLDGLLRARRERLIGILNGIDRNRWDPQQDPHLTAPFGVDDLSGKRVAKAALQRELGFEESPGTPLIGHIGRMVEQKGVDLLVGNLDRLLARKVQVVILGSGHQRWERQLEKLAARHPRQLAVYIGFDEERAHRVEAGIDIFVMPSRYEPCGLNQFYSLRYGSVPVARRTGGLADSVVDTNELSLAEGRANGFLFDAVHPDALWQALVRALDSYRNPELWQEIMSNGMRLDFGWERAAERYQEAYRRAISLAG